MYLNIMFIHVYMTCPSSYFKCLKYNTIINTNNLITSWTIIYRHNFTLKRNARSILNVNQKHPGGCDRSTGKRSTSSLLLCHVVMTDKFLCVDSFVDIWYDVHLRVITTKKSKLTIYLCLLIIAQLKVLFCLLEFSR